MKKKELSKEQYTDLCFDGCASLMAICAMGRLIAQGESLYIASLIIYLIWLSIKIYERKLKE